MTGGSRKLAVLWMPAVMLCLSRGPALSDPRPGNDKDRQVASDLVKRAIARSSAGDHAGAIKIYLEAYTLSPNSLLLSNIGAEFQQDGMYKEALEYFCKYLQEDPAGTNAPYARSQAKILQRQLGRKKVGDRDLCASPPRDRDKDDDATGDIVARSDTGRRTDTGRSETGRTEPGRTDAGRTDSDRTDAGRGDAGRATRKASGTADLTAPEREPAASSTGNATLMYLGLAAGVAGLAAAGIGIYDGIQAQNISDQISGHDPMAPWPDDIRTLQDRGQRYENLQIGFLIGSGVLVTTGVVLYVVSRPDAAPEHRGDKASVGLAPTRNGVAVFGRF